MPPSWGIKAMRQADPSTQALSLGSNEVDDLKGKNNWLGGEFCIAKGELFLPDRLQGRRLMA